MSQGLGLLERLEQGVVLGAEGYVFELERRGYLQAGAYVPKVVLEHPEVVKQLHAQAFPIALDPFQVTRFEMAEFAIQARNLGVDYIGICCGAGPHHVRAMAEALGRTVPAGRYSPDMDMHPALGANVKERDKPYLKNWKD